MLLTGGASWLRLSNKVGKIIDIGIFAEIMYARCVRLPLYDLRLLIGILASLEETAATSVIHLKMKVTHQRGGNLIRATIGVKMISPSGGDPLIMTQVHGNKGRMSDYWEDFGAARGSF